MSSTNLIFIASIIVYAALTLALTEFFRRHIRIAAVFFILAIFTFPLWGANRDSWFEWAKIVSVLVPTALLGLGRIANFENRQGKFWNLLKGKWLLWFFYGILFLNITEASVRDWQLGNYFNCLTGFALNITIPFVAKFWRFDRRERGDLIVDFPKGWCLLYTSWNACFIFAAIPDEFAGGFAILIAAEVYSLIGRPDLYVMARVYTLALFVLHMGTVNVLPFMNTAAWYNPVVVHWWGIANLVLAGIYIMWYNWQMYTGKCDKKFRHPKTAPIELEPNA